MPIIEIESCDKCPHWDHSGGFTKGGAKPQCGATGAKKNLPCKWDPDDHSINPKKVATNKIPGWCPLKNNQEKKTMPKKSVEKPSNLGLQSKFLTNQAYHSGPGVSSSNLKTMASKSALHAHYEKYHQTPQTDAMLEGEAFHIITLEPHTFNDHVVVLPEGETLRTNVNKKRKADAIAAGKLFINHKQFELVSAMRKAVLDHPLASNLLMRMDGTIYERAVFWHDELTKLLCKVKLDCLTMNNNCNVIIDLKKAKDGDIKKFQNQAGNLKYHIQAAMYSEGVREGLGKEVDYFIFVVVEPYAPFAVGVYIVSKEMAQEGYDQYRILLDQWATCTKSGVWPGYSDDKAVQMELPPWLT